jgi:hypothetical protein
MPTATPGSSMLPATTGNSMKNEILMSDADGTPDIAMAARPELKRFSVFVQVTTMNQNPRSRRNRGRRLGFACPG